MFRLICVVLTLLIWGGCGSGSDNGKNPNGDFLATYELEDGCTTGRQVFKGSSEDELGKAFVMALKITKKTKTARLFNVNKRLGQQSVPARGPMQILVA